jgi:hypothetical protein
MTQPAASSPLGALPSSLARAAARSLSHTARVIGRPSVLSALAWAYGALLLAAVVVDVAAPGFATRKGRTVVEVGSGEPLPSIGQCLARGLMERRFAVACVARLKDDFDCGCRVPDVYEPHENPRVCVIVQSFNHAGNVKAIADALMGNALIDEVVICEDGSNDGSRELWVEALQGLRHFVIVSNNLHEVRCYNRAMRMSSAEFFVLLQDDDLPDALATVDVAAAREGHAEQQETVGDLPARNWVRDGLDLMEADPTMGVLSGFIGQMWDAEGKGYEFGEQQSDHGGLMKGSTRRIPFLSKATRRPFMYVECAWIAPLMVRGSVLKRVGGLDVDVFRVGEPGMWQDCLLSYAAWSAGWRVGVYDAMFERGVGGHGSTSSPEKAKMRDTMWKKVKAVVDDRFERGFVREHVLKLNNVTLMQRY